jgi:hypothetical protein
MSQSKISLVRTALHGPTSISRRQAHVPPRLQAAQSRSPALTATTPSTWANARLMFAPDEIVGDADVNRLRLYVAEVARLVELDTGLPINMEEVTVELLPANEALRRISEEAAVRTGNIGNDYVDPDFIDRLRNRIASLGTERAIAGAWLPSLDVMVLVAERVRKMNGSALGRLIAHELRHTAQDFHYPQFWDYLHAVAKEALSALVEVGNDDDNPRYQEATDRLNALMAMVEGEATYAMNRNINNRFPNPKGAFDAESAAGTVLSLLSKSGRRKAFQYVEGAMLVNAIHEAGESELLEVMFQHPELAEAALRRRGRMELRLDDDVPQEQVDAVRETLRMLRKLNLVGQVYGEGLTIEITSNGRTLHTLEPS